MKLNYGGYNANNQESLTNPKIPWWLSFPALTIITMLFFPVGVFLIWKRAKIDTNSKGIITIVIGWMLIFFVGFMTLILSSQGISSEDYNVICFLLFVGSSLIFLGRKKRKDSEKLKKYISTILTNKETSINNIAAVIPTSYKTARKDVQNLIKKGYLNGIYINEATGEIIFPREQGLNNRDVQSNQEMRSNQPPHSNQESHSNQSSHGNVYTSVHSTTTTSGNIDPDTARRIFENVQPLMDMAFNTNGNTNINVNTNTNTNTSETVVACKGCGANNKIIRGSLAECQYCGSLIDN